MDLSTQYLGLNLKNPIIVASCGLTKTVEQMKQCEDAGAGAVVMKSLLEEQLREVETELEDDIGMHSEVLGYLRADIGMRYGSDKYFTTIEHAKKALSIPVIASVNCYTSKWWTKYAKQIEDAGADALELNVYVLPVDFNKSAADVEDVYLDILKTVKAQISIPVALKLPMFFTSFGHFATRLEHFGADGLVLFNRYVQPEIDIEKVENKMIGSFTDPAGFHRTLRWIGLLSGTLELDLAASGGIRNAHGVIKQLLAGATAVQIASLFYAQGLEKIQELLDGLQEWMEAKQFKSIAAFKGRLNQVSDQQHAAYIRAQYVKSLVGIE